MKKSIDLIDADLTHVNEEKVAEIRASIALIGLLHPITVREASGQQGRYDLITGKTRLKACKDLHFQEIEVHIETSEVSALEIAIHENLRRANLDWQEQVRLEQELHDLRQEQHGVKRTGRGAASSPGWSQIDTARELGIALGSMSQDLFLANALKDNPNLRNVKDKNTALRLAKDIAKRSQLEADSLTPASFEMNQVFCGDSVDILKSIPNDTFNACITDPPWLEFRDKRLTKDSSTLPVFEQVYRTLKHDSMLYAFVSTPDFHFYQKALPEFGFQVQEFPLIWDKEGVISQGRVSWQYGRTYEPILVAAKGRPALTKGTQFKAVLKFTPIFPTKLRHPNEKPVALMRELLSHSTFKESKIIDPFAGSGSLLVAAREMGRNYIGIERNPDYYQKIIKRLEKEKEQI